MKKFLISASILSSDFSRLGEDVTKVILSGSDMIHFDVMDNHYVPNLTAGPMILKALRNYGITVPIDVHLMVKPVDHLILSFIESGATYISFHPEASEHIDRSIQLIKKNQCKAGLAFNPSTSLNYLEYTIHQLDIITIMSVNPGFGGQSFLPSTIDKIQKTRKLIDSSKRNIFLEVDGGIKKENIKSIILSGANICVIGSAIFNQNDYSVAINSMHSELKNFSVMKN